MPALLRFLTRRPLILLSLPGTLWHLSSFTDVVSGKQVDYWDDDGHLVLCDNQWGFGKVPSRQPYRSKYHGGYLGVRGV